MKTMAMTGVEKLLRIDNNENAALDAQCMKDWGRTFAMNEIMDFVHKASTDEAESKRLITNYFIELFQVYNSKSELKGFFDLPKLPKYDADAKAQG